MNLAKSIAGEASAYWQRVKRFTPNARWIILSQASRHVGTGVRSAIFNLYLLALGYSTAFVGGILSLGIFTMAFGALVFGPVTQRIGERNAMILANLITMIAAFIQVIHPVPEILLSMTLLFNLGSSLITTSYGPLMTKSSTPYERTHLFGSSQAFRIASSFTGSILGGYLPGWFALIINLPFDSAHSFQLALYAWVIPFAFATIPLLFIRKESHFISMENDKIIQNSDTNESMPHTFEKEPKGQPLVIAKFALTSGIIGFGAGFIVPFMNIWFWEFYNLPTYIVGIVTGLGQGTMAAGVLLAPVLSTRIGKVKTTFFTQALSLPFIVTLAVIVNPIIAIISYLVRGVLMNATNPVNASFSMEMVPSSWRPHMSAARMASQGFARSASSLISGQIFDQGLYLLPFWFTLICYTTSTALYGLMFWRAEDQLAAELEEQVPAPMEMEQ